MVLRGVESSLARVRRIGAQRVYRVCGIAPPALRGSPLLQSIFVKSRELPGRFVVTTLFSDDDTHRSEHGCGRGEAPVVRGLRDEPDGRDDIAS